MNRVELSWDEAKNRANQRKHGVSFDEAQSVFVDENARIIHDSKHSGEEDRFLLLGMSRNLRVLVVCHCYRERDNIIRIISARKASRAEQRQYEEFL